MLTVAGGVEAEHGLSLLGMVHRIDSVHVNIATAAAVDGEDDGVDGGFLASGARHDANRSGALIVVGTCGGDTGRAEDTLLGTVAVVEVDTAAVGFFDILGVGGTNSHGHLGAAHVLHDGRDGVGIVQCLSVGHLGESRFDAGVQRPAGGGVEGHLEAIGLIFVAYDGDDAVLVRLHGDGHKEGGGTGGVGSVGATIDLVVVMHMVGVVAIARVVLVVDDLGTLVGVVRELPHRSYRMRRGAAVAVLQHHPVVAVLLLAVDRGRLPGGGTEVPVVPVGALLQRLSHLGAHNL